MDWHNGGQLLRLLEDHAPLDEKVITSTLRELITSLLRDLITSPLQELITSPEGAARAELRSLTFSLTALVLGPAHGSGVRYRVAHSLLPALGVAVPAWRCVEEESGGFVPAGPPSGPPEPLPCRRCSPTPPLDEADDRRGRL